MNQISGDVGIDVNFEEGAGNDMTGVWGGVWCAGGLPVLYIANQFPGT